MEQIAKLLLDVKAVFLNAANPYKWSSGIISPIYCDNRILLSHVDVRNTVELALKALIVQQFPDAQALVGTATAGIPHAAYVSALMGLPMGYVRSSIKEHGRNKIIEGGIAKHTKVVVIEDLISTGKSVANVINHLQNEGMEVLGVVSIFTYGLNDSLETFTKLHLPCYNLTNYNELIKVAQNHNFITGDDFKKLTKWKVDPWSQDWMK